MLNESSNCVYVAINQPGKYLCTLGRHTKRFKKMWVHCIGYIGDVAEYEHFVKILGWSEHFIKYKLFLVFQQNHDFLCLGSHRTYAHFDFLAFTFLCVTRLYSVHFNLKWPIILMRGMYGSQTYPLKLNLSDNKENFVVFTSLTVLNSYNFKSITFILDQINIFPVIINIKNCF